MAVHFSPDVPLAYAFLARAATALPLAMHFSRKQPAPPRVSARPSHPHAKSPGPLARPRAVSPYATCSSTHDHSGLALPSSFTERTARR